MAMCRRLYFTGNKIVSSLKFSTTCSVSNKWRREQGLEPDPKQFGPLTRLPDYSFVDGRPTILSRSKYAKLKYQENICRRIVELTNELDVGLQKYHEEEENKRKIKEEILRNKLKPKGAKLLTRSNICEDPES